MPREPFAGPDKLLDYLGRYVKRVAISNERILDLDEDGQRVAFRWRDYADQNHLKVMWLSCEEFIRRFLRHILPKGFSKVRYYGLLANRDKGKRLGLCRNTLGQSPKLKAVQTNWQERFYQLTGIDPSRCPCCERGKMHTIAIVLPIRAPPYQRVEIVDTTVFLIGN
ncbi:MAG: transposase [Saprospiraceae bacterium]